MISTHSSSRSKPGLPAISAYISEPDHTSSHRIEIEATPDQVWPYVENLDVSGSTIIRILFSLRGMGSVKTVKDFEEMGFRRLDVDPPNTLVYGLIGQFWKPTGHIVDFEPSEFQTFDEPGYAKAVASFDLTEERGRTVLRTETLVVATDEISRRRFSRYWTFIGPFSGLIRREILRSIRNQVES